MYSHSVLNSTKQKHTCTLTDTVVALVLHITTVDHREQKPTITYYSTWLLRTTRQYIQ